MSREIGSCQYSGNLKDCYNQLERFPQPYVTYNSKLKCPELSPWLQKVALLKKNTARRPAPSNIAPKNYHQLRKSRFINKYKYYQPLTPHFRYYDETECYIEEYRLYKSPTAWKRQLELEREYNYLTALSIETLSSGSNHSSSPKPRNKKHRDYLSRTGARGDEDAYLNNAKVSSYNSPSKRVAIKIPKCETKIKNRRTFFPVILSKYKSGAGFWVTIPSFLEFQDSNHAKSPNFFTGEWAEI